VKPRASPEGLSHDELISTLLTEIRGLRADLQALHRKRDPLKPGELLAAIAVCAGEREFTTAELCNHARYAEPLRAVISGRSPKVFA
jgi:hypothetical protein